MNDYTDNTMVDIKKLVSDNNPSRAITVFIKNKIKERVFISDKDDSLYLCSFINSVNPLRWFQLSSFTSDFGDLNSNSISPKMLNDFFNIVESSVFEYQDISAKNCVLVEINMPLNEIVCFGDYPIWIFSTKTVQDTVLSNNNNSSDKYDIKLN